jgi:hypothetical protein
MRRKHPRPRGLVEVSQVLEGALKNLGIQGDWNRYRIEAKCREWLGEKASKAMTGVEERKGTVTLYFSHSVWLNEMNFRRQEGLEYLKREFPRLDLREMRATLSKNPARHS